MLYHLRIVLKDIGGYHNEYKDNDKYIVKKMNFKLDDNSLDKVIDILAHIGNKLKIDLEDYLYEDRRGEEYFKAIVPGETLFRKDNDDEVITIQNEKSKYNC